MFDLKEVCEGLSSMLRRHEAVGLIHGVPIVRGHLTFQIFSSQMIATYFSWRMV